IDRAKDVGALSEGTPFAPQFIENKLKFSPYIREAVAFGNERPFVTAMIAIDLTTVGTWAERRGLAYTSYADLSQKADIRGLVRAEIANCNATLPDATKIRHFLLLSIGVLIGLMYALIALGFVLVYKATDAVNFAQGEFVMIAGFVVAGCLGVWGVPLWLAVPLALGSMVAFGFVLERVMLRKLIGRPVIAVVMATIGLASILRGIGPFTIFSGTKPLPLPVSDEPFVLGPLFIPPIQLTGGLISLAFLAGFSWFFLKSRNNRKSTRLNSSHD